MKKIITILLSAMLMLFAFGCTEPHKHSYNYKGTCDCGEQKSVVTLSTLMDQGVRVSEIQEVTTNKTYWYKVDGNVPSLFLASAFEGTEKVDVIKNAWFYTQDGDPIVRTIEMGDYVFHSLEGNADTTQLYIVVTYKQACTIQFAIVPCMV